MAYTELWSKSQLPEGSKSLGAEPFSRMVEILLRRTLGSFELLAILFLLVNVGSRKIEGSRRGEVLAKNIKSESLADATRYRWIERTMRNHLQNHPDVNNSFVHMLVHPKANPRLSEAVLKAFGETKSVMIRRDDLSSVFEGCIVKETRSKISRVVGIYDSVEDINPEEWKVSYGLCWNPRSKIAIWLDHYCCSDYATEKFKFEAVLARFWSLNVVNVVLLVSPWCESEINSSSKLRVFGYDPFVPGPGGKRGKLFERSFDQPLFPDKLKNLHGVPIRMSMYHQEPHSVLINNHSQLGSGIEISNLLYISSWLNFTVDLVTAPTTLFNYTTQLPDGEVLGPIGDILTNRSVYLANSDYIEKTWGRRVEFLNPIDRGPVLILVPPAGQIPGILKIFRGVDFAVSGLILFTSLVVISYFVARRKRNPLFSLFRLLMYQQIEVIDDRSPERIFLIFCIIWAFIISTAVQGQLVKDLSSRFYNSIDTLEELAESSLTLMIDRETIDSLRNDDSKIKKRLGERSIFQPNFDRCTEILLAHNNVSCAIDFAYIWEMEKNLNTKARDKVEMLRRRGKKSVHIVKEPLADYWRTIVVQEGFPYLSKFNEAYQKIKEFGLITKWVGRISRRQFETRSRRARRRNLRMKYFEGAFKIHAIGLCIALVVFLGEIVFYYVKKRLRAQAGNRSHKRKSQPVRTVDRVSLKRIGPR